MLQTQLFVVVVGLVVASATSEQEQQILLSWVWVRQNIIGFFYEKFVSTWICARLMATGLPSITRVLKVITGKNNVDGISLLNSQACFYLINLINAQFSPTYV